MRRTLRKSNFLFPQQEVKIFQQGNVASLALCTCQTLFLSVHHFSMTWKDLLTWEVVGSNIPKKL